MFLFFDEYQYIVQFYSLHRLSGRKECPEILKTKFKLQIFPKGLYEI